MIDVSIWVAVLTGIFGILTGIFTGYLTSHLNQLADRRGQLSRALADYYASAARVYYAWHELVDESKESPNWQYLHGEYWKYYESFLKTSTAVFSLYHEKWERRYSNSKLCEPKLYMIPQMAPRINGSRS